ncbi:uncharacterized protein LOC112022943 isoform X2 [Quercus suber]|uniref:uncharacterized protein LOC112022943 isoform X2 n=1 Tax=Quercus suber TaxID=58331 RepID=UPI0032DF9662
MGYFPPYGGMKWSTQTVWRGLQKSIGAGEMERHLRPAPLLNSNHQKICIPQLVVHCYRVAYKLKVMHEGCLEGKFQSIERLRETNQQKAVVHHVKQLLKHMGILSVFVLSTSK